MKFLLATLTVMVVLVGCSSNRYKPPAPEVAAERQQYQQRQRAEYQSRQRAQRERQRDAQYKAAEQQVSINLFRALREFLRERGYSNAGTLVDTLQRRMEHFGKLTDPTAEQNQRYYDSQNSAEQQLIRQVDQPSFRELLIEFADMIRRRGVCMQTHSSYFCEKNVR